MGDAGGMGMFTQFVNKGMDAAIWNPVERQAGRKEYKYETANNYKYWKMMQEDAYKMQGRAFNDFGIPGQLKQMKEQGLNPGLMYKGSGAGGMTAPTVSAPGGSGKAGTGVSGGAIDPTIGAQMELIHAQTDKTRAEAENLRGIERDWKRADLPVKGEDARSRILENDYREYKGLDNRSGNERRAQQEDVNIRQSEQSITKMIQDVDNKEEELAIQWRNAKTQQERTEAQTRIETFKAELEALYPGQDKVTGRMLNETLENLNRLTGQKESREERRRRIYGN